MKAHHQAIAFVVVLVLAACASLAPKTFSESLAAGYTTVTANRQLNVTLMDARVISGEDGENVQKQNDNARAGLDIASKLGPDAGKDKLASTVTVLNGIKQYLLSKQAKR